MAHGGMVGNCCVVGGDSAGGSRSVKPRAVNQGGSRQQQLLLMDFSLWGRAILGLPLKSEYVAMSIQR